MLKKLKEKNKREQKKTKANKWNSNGQSAKWVDKEKIGFQNYCPGLKKKL